MSRYVYAANSVRCACQITTFENGQGIDFNHYKTLRISESTPTASTGMSSMSSTLLSSNFTKRIIEVSDSCSALKPHCGGTAVTPFTRVFCQTSKYRHVHCGPTCTVGHGRCSIMHNGYRVPRQSIQLPERSVLPAKSGRPGLDKFRHSKVCASVASLLDVGRPPALNQYWVGYLWVTKHRLTWRALIALEQSLLFLLSLSFVRHRRGWAAVTIERAYMLTPAVTIRKTTHRLPPPPTTAPKSSLVTVDCGYHNQLCILAIAVKMKSTAVPVLFYVRLDELFAIFQKLARDLNQADHNYRFS